MRWTALEKRQCLSYIVFGVMHHFASIQAQCHLVKQNPINKELINVWKLNLHKEYIALASSKCFTKKQLLWGRWCLNLVFSDFMHHCVSHPSASGLRLVKFWNCQSHITCEIFNFQTHFINHILFMDVTSTIDKCPLSEFSRLVRSAAAVSSDVRHVTPVSIAVRRIINPSFSLSS